MNQPGAVIAGEEDEGVFVQSGGPQRVEHATHGGIEFLHHIAIQPAQAFALLLSRSEERHMGESVGEVEKEWLGLVLGDEVRRLLGITPCERGLIGRLLDQFFVAVERGVPPIGVLVQPTGSAFGRDAGLGVHVIGMRQAEEEVEAVLARMTGGIVGPDAEVPFADAPGGIALGLEMLGQGDLVVRKMAGGLVAQHAELIVAHAAADRVAPREQPGAAGGADFGGGIEVCESHAFRRHAIQVRRANARMAIAA